MNKENKLVAHIEVAKYCEIKGWAYFVDDFSAKVIVQLLDSNNVVLSEMLADRIVKDAPSGTQVGDSGYVFYGILKDVAKIVFLFDNNREEEALHISQPQSLSCLSNYGFYLIHPDDMILQYVLDLGNDIEECVRHYITFGEERANNLKTLCQRYLNENEVPYDLLDFASGYGRVARSLDKSVFCVTVSDIHDEAIRFMSKELGLKAFLSTTNPHEFTSEHTYDVVFALSFFSHMPDQTFGDWIRALFNLVKPNGLLIFTTHGRIDKMKSGIPVEDGFGFVSSSEQKDLDTSDYGTTISEATYVIKVLNEYIGELPILFEEGAAIGSGHQDVYVVRKPEAALEIQVDFEQRYNDLREQREGLEKQYNDLAQQNDDLNKLVSAIYDSRTWKAGSKVKKMAQFLCLIKK